MPNEPKFSLVEPTEQESANFMKKFQELLVETSMYYEPVPQFSRKSLQSPWEIVCQIFLQKKVPITEEKDVISPIQDVIPPEVA